MKKILWICNIMLPVIAKELGFSYSNREGWLSGIYARIRGGDRLYEIIPCVPISREDMEALPKERILGGSKEHQRGVPCFRKLQIEDAVCYVFEEDLNCPERYDSGLERLFREIFADAEPSMIHIFGTEFPHALAAARAYQNPAHTLVGIQGLCGEIARVYRAGLPDDVWSQVSFRDFLKKDSMKQQQNKFVQRGEHEKQLLELAGHITGRTEFDQQQTAAIHPDAVYHAMNETMRSEFYEGNWNIGDVEPYSIFLGQGDYPLKGMHFLLEAMGQLKDAYPQLHLYVAGNSIISHRTFKEKLKLSAYGKYLLVLLRIYELEDKVTVLGKLTAEEMKAQFLRSSVFVCPSVLENSPNTVGEAMLLGVPVVASRTGGIPSMIEDGETGLLFQNQDVDDLADSIAQIWSNPGYAVELSQKERIRAGQVHDGEQNYERLLEIYGEILG